MGTITVAGTGKISVRPNIATVTFQVQTQGTRTSEAISKNNLKMAEIVKVVEAHFDEKDRKTSGFSIQPQYVYHTPRKGQKEKPPTLEGYLCLNGMTLKLRNLDALSDVLGALTDAGADQLGFNFGIDNMQLEEDEARMLAFDDAKRKAVIYCERAGLKLGPVETLTEHVARNYKAYGAAGAACVTRSAALESVAVEAGEEDVTANINVVFTTIACSKPECRADTQGGCRAGTFERCKKAAKAKKKK